MNDKMNILFFTLLNNKWKEIKNKGKKKLYYIYFVE